MRGMLGFVAALVAGLSCGSRTALDGPMRAAATTMTLDRCTSGEGPVVECELVVRSQVTVDAKFARAIFARGNGFDLLTYETAPTSMLHVEVSPDGTIAI